MTVFQNKLNRFFYSENTVKFDEYFEVLSGIYFVHESRLDNSFRDNYSMKKKINIYIDIVIFRNNTWPQTVP